VRCEIQSIQSLWGETRQLTSGAQKNTQSNFFGDIFYLQEFSLGQPRAPQLPPKCQLQRAEMASGWINRSLRMKGAFELWLQGNVPEKCQLDHIKTIMKLK